MQTRLRLSPFFITITLLLVCVLIFLRYYSFPDSTSPYVVDTPWERNVGFSGADRFRYLFYATTGRYAEFAWAVRTSYAIVLTCCAAVILLSIVMAYDVFNRRRKAKRYAELQELYGQPLRELARSDRKMSETEVAEKLNKNGDSQWSYAYRLLWIDLFIEVRIETDIQNEGLANMKQAMQILGLVDFMETRLIQGKDSEKLRIIQAVRLLEMAIADSVMARLVNHRHAELRKAARFYYMLVNRDNPYRFFEQDEVGGDLLTWDSLELHQLFADCVAMGKRLPSFIPLMERSRNPELVSFLILETAYWGSHEEVRFLTSYFRSPHTSLRLSAFQAMGLRRFSEAENDLKEVFYAQTEELRRVILRSLLEIKSGNSILFFGEAYRNSASDQTRLTALACLWLSGAEGQTHFLQLKDQSSVSEQPLFNHVSASRSSLLNHLI